ncbi:MAG: hypothetical protein ACFB03_03195 [Paracoccaceae bacterium]
MRSTALGLTLAAAITAMSGNVNAADKFAAADVLGWDQGQRDWYIQISVTMASIYASQIDKPKGSCIASWYLKSAQDRAVGNERITEVFREFPDHHPGTAIFAVLNMQCGILSP